jgi:hypothetical protein
MNRFTLLAAASLVGAYGVISALPFRCEPCTQEASFLQFKIFRFLSAVVITLAIVIGMAMWKLIRDLWNEGLRAGVLSAGVEIGAVTGFGAWLFNAKSIYAFRPEWHVEFPQAVISALILICYLMVALPCAVWMTMGRNAFRRIGDVVAPPLAAAAEFQRLRDQAQIVGTLCALGIASATLPLGAWRRVVIAADKSLATTFPPEYVVLFGLYWSMFLAAGYVPLYLAGARAGQTIRDSIVPPVAPSIDNFSDWQKKRQEVEAHLGIGPNAFDSLKLALAILAPLLGGILSMLISGVDKG